MSPNELRSKLRLAAEDDKGKPRVSYSKLDLFNTCPRRYKKKYIEEKSTDSATLPLELGTILHKGLEMKGSFLMNHEPVYYDMIKNTVLNGCDEVTEKSSSHLYGINEIRQRYGGAWMDSFLDPEVQNYEEKVQIYLNKVLPTRMEEEGWKVIGVEVPFEFVFDDRCIMHGFIDRVDENEDGDLRVVDYKSSKKSFPDAKIKTPLQMIIYDMACMVLFDRLPIYHEYDFILLDEKQTTEDGVCSRGYLSRGIKKINSLLNKINESEHENEFHPIPTPLCYWCPYAPKSHTPNADPKWGGECLYYSLWTPDQKVFSVNRKYIPGEAEPPRRKLKF